MQDQIKALEDIRDIFSIFHDGIIVAYSGTREFLTLEIECRYLAERIQKHYTTFYISLHSVNSLEFQPWLEPDSLPPTVFTTLNEIFQAELDILSAEIEANHVNIICNQTEANFNYCGGSLVLSCSKIMLYDQNMNSVSVDELDRIYQEYWSKWSEGNSGFTK